jgi:hypothetical protein
MKTRKVHLKRVLFTPKMSQRAIGMIPAAQRTLRVAIR